MELKIYLQMIRKGWWIIVLTMLVALNATLIFDYLTPPSYLASSRFLVSPNPSVLVTESDQVNSLEALDSRSIVVTYSEILNSRRIYQEALLANNIPLISAEDYVAITVVLPDANVLELTVTGEDPQVVTNLANTIGQLAISNISSLYRAYNISVLDPAVVPTVPVSPVPARDALLAVAMGLVLGVAIAIFSEQIRIPLESFRQRLRIDSLTGVYTSQYFRKLVEDAITENPEEAPTVGIVELSGLQELQETLPPVAFQMAMERARDILRRELRGNDDLGRWNTFSYIVMLPSTPGTAAGRTFDRIFQSLKQPMEFRQYNITLNLDPHIGGAVYNNSLTAKELLDQAESVLEKSRQSQESPVNVWEMNNPFLIGKDA